MAECPNCGAKVRKEKLRRHISKVHTQVTPAKPKATTAKPASTVAFPWQALAAMAVVGVLIVAGYWFVSQSGGGGGGGGGSTTELPVAVIVVQGFGTFEIELDTVHAPRTAANFIGLANAGFYNGLTFHRIMEGFVIQGGDPNGDGSGGTTQIDFERTGLKNVYHSVAMARGDSPNSASCQFYINFADNPSLDDEPYPYVVFGRILSGHDVILALEQVPVTTNPGGENSKPLNPPVMTSVTIRNG